MGHDDVASGYPISIGFRRFTGCQRDPRDKVLQRACVLDLKDSWKELLLLVEFTYNNSY